MPGVIKSIRDIMRKDAGVDGDAQRIGQLAWMLFLKLFDDKEREWELMTSNYRSPVPDDLKWRNWAADPEGITGDDLLDLVNNRLFPTLRKAYVSQSRRHALVRAVFEDSYNYMKSGTLLRQVVNKLNAIDFTASKDRHLFNDVYETILRELQSAGSSGEYYTPRPVTRFMTEMTDPKLGETVLDPACGTGGFLIDTIEHLRRQGVKSLEAREQLQAMIRGTEKKALPHLLCVTNLLLHDIEDPKVTHGNSLAKTLVSYGPADRVDCVLTNPPFGGIEEDGIELNFPSKYQTRETADLFMALILRLLKPGGRAAVVLPDGFLFGEGVKTRLKEDLLAKCDLHTIVRLPNGVFAPYTDINTNLLFFTKGEPTTHVWYVEHPLPKSYKKYTKTRPIRFKEFAYLKAWWTDRKPTDFAWKVDVGDLIARDGNLDLNHPSTEEPEDTRSTEDILVDLDRSNQRVADALAQLRAALHG